MTSESNIPQEAFIPDPAVLLRLARTTMPFGKHAGRLVIDVPEDYLLWFSKKGFPPGELGRQLALMLEIRINGLEGLFDRLR